MTLVCLYIESQDEPGENQVNNRWFGAYNLAVT